MLRQLQSYCHKITKSLNVNHRKFSEGREIHPAIERDLCMLDKFVVASTNAECTREKENSLKYISTINGYLLLGWGYRGVFDIMRYNPVKRKWCSINASRQATATVRS